MSDNPYAPSPTPSALPLDVDQIIHQALLSSPRYVDGLNAINANTLPGNVPPPADPTLNAQDAAAAAALNAPSQTPPSSGPMALGNSIASGLRSAAGAITGAGQRALDAAGSGMQDAAAPQIDVAGAIGDAGQRALDAAGSGMQDAAPQIDVSGATPTPTSTTPTPPASVTTPIAANSADDTVPLPKQRADVGLPPVAQSAVMDPYAGNQTPTAALVQALQSAISGQAPPVANATSPSPVATQPASQVRSGPDAVGPGGAFADTDTLGQTQRAIRQAESGGDYTAKNPNSTASGAYQFLDSTWSQAAKASGVQGATQYVHAGDAPPATQDAVASYTLRTQGVAPWMESAGQGGGGGWAGQLAKSGVDVASLPGFNARYVSPNDGHGAFGPASSPGGAGGSSVVSQAQNRANAAGALSGSPTADMGPYAGVIQAAINRSAAINPQGYSPAQQALGAAWGTLGGQTMAQGNQLAGQNVMNMQRYNTEGLPMTQAHAAQQLADIGLNANSAYQRNQISQGQLGLQRQEFGLKSQMLNVPEPMGAPVLAADGTMVQPMRSQLTGQVSSVPLNGISPQVYAQLHAGQIAGQKAMGSIDAKAYAADMASVGQADDAVHGYQQQQQIIDQLQAKGLMGPSMVAQGKRQVAATLGLPEQAMIDAYRHQSDTDLGNTLKNMLPNGTRLAAPEINAFRNISEGKDTTGEAAKYLVSMQLRRAQANADWAHLISDGRVSANNYSLAKANFMKQWDESHAAPAAPGTASAGAGSANGASQSASAALQGYSGKPLAGLSAFNNGGTGN